MGKSSFIMNKMDKQLFCNQYKVLRVVAGMANNIVLPAGELEASAHLLGMGE